jgi:uncharacterized protein (TIGR04255 family)
VAHSANESIVSFASPPVVEVVAGVAYDGLTAEAGALLAAFWKEQLRREFPALQQQPPYSPPDEQFPYDGGRSISLNLIPGLPAARLWAQSSDGQEVLQLQPGWFACNWRKVQSGGEYDRWSSRREAFKRNFMALSDYLASEGAGQPKVRQCEVTYINHISVSSTWEKHSDFAKIFKISRHIDTPYPLEQASYQAQFRLDGNDEPYGRIYVKVLPAFGADGKTPLYVFELTARGMPLGDGVEGALAFLDRGREAVDLTFVALTTDAMHREWGFQQ